MSYRSIPFLFLGILPLLGFSCKGPVGSGNHMQADSIAGILFQDSQNNYWFEIKEKGVGRFNGRELALFSKADGLCGLRIISVQEDKEGNLYFDTTDGVCRFDGNSFTSLEVVKGSADKWQLHPDDLWFRMGWDQPGPYRFDGTNLYSLEFPQAPLEKEFHAKYPNASYNPYGIYSMYFDSDGVLWFGTASFGLCRFDGENFGWLYEEHLTQTPAGGDFGIRSIVEDEAGHFWFCNTRYRFEILPDSTHIRKESNWLNYRKEEGAGYTDSQGNTSFPYFMSIVKDDEGDLWMLTYDEGVWRKKGEELIHYPVKDGEKTALLFSIYKDNEGTIWLGEHGGGTYVLKDDAFHRFTF
ncbi:MAG: hypothetical protein GYB31_09365 [Bacteroidetes bacterium]|nr:hypothetical protein [Bacteroidota bacterium]